MLFADESVLQLQDMDSEKKTPQQVLAEYVKQHGIGATEFKRLCGYSNESALWQTINMEGTFGERKQRKVARALGLPDDYFSKPGRTRKIEAYVEQQFDEFLKSEIGLRCEKEFPEVITLLRAMPFVSTGKLPTKALFEYLALVMLGEGRFTTEELAIAQMENEEADSYPPPTLDM